MKKLITSILLALVCNFSFAQISGPSAVQPGNNYVFTYGSSIGAQYFWSVTGNSTILSGQGTNSVTVRTNSSGNVCVTRYGNGLTPSCDCKSISISNVDPCAFNIENPRLVVLNPNWGNLGETCGNEILEVQALLSSYNNVVNYEWRIAGSTYHEPHRNRDYIFVRTNSTIGTIVNFDVRVNYDCGITSDWVGITGSVVNCQFGGGQLAFAAREETLNNNIASEDNILYNSSTKAITVPEDFKLANYKIANINGQTIKTGTLEKSDDSTIDISNLSHGVFIISIEKNGKRNNVKFLVTE